MQKQRNIINCSADQRLCFRYINSTIPLLSQFEISSLYPSSVAEQPGLCRTWSETPKTGFLTTRLNFFLTRYCYQNYNNIGPTSSARRTGSGNILSVFSIILSPKDHHQTRHSQSSHALFETDGLERLT